MKNLFSVILLVTFFSLNLTNSRFLSIRRQLADNQNQDCQEKVLMSYYECDADCGNVFNSDMDSLAICKNDCFYAQEKDITLMILKIHKKF